MSLPPDANGAGTRTRLHRLFKPCSIAGCSGNRFAGKAPELLVLFRVGKLLELACKLLRRVEARLEALAPIPRLAETNLCVRIN